MNKWNKLRKQNLGVIPQEASQNLQAPETSPLRKNMKVNIRTKPLNFKVSEEFYRQLRELAVKEDCFMVEVVEKAVKEYQKKEKTQGPEEKFQTLEQSQKEHTNHNYQKLVDNRHTFCSFFG